MITIPDILKPRHVNLQLGEITQSSGVFEVTSLLRQDSRVLDWPRFYEEVRTRNPCVAGGQQFEICIPHARTDAVSSMVMAVGRSVAGIQLETKKVNYIFVIGVPVPLTADYLRIIGALARIFRDPDSEQELRATDDPQQFIELLSQKEMRL